MERLKAKLPTSWQSIRLPWRARDNATKPGFTLNSLPIELVDIIIKFSVEGARTLPRCLCDEHNLSKETRSSSQDLSHPLLSVSQRLRRRTLEYFVRSHSYIEIRVFGDNVKINRLLRRARRHGRMVNQDWIEQGVIKPSVGIRVEGPDHRLKARAEVQHLQVITLLYHPHTLGSLFHHIAEADFGSIGDTSTVLDLEIQLGGPTRDQFEIATFFDTFRNVFQDGQPTSGVSSYTRGMDRRIRRWMRHTFLPTVYDLEYFSEWDASAMNFLRGVEVLLSNNHLDAAISLLLSCAGTVILGSYHTLRLDVDSFKNSRWSQDATIRAQARCLRLRCQLSSLASLAFIEMHEIYPPYSMNHNMRRRDFFRFEDDDLFSYSVYTGEDDVPREYLSIDTHELFGIFAIADANVYYKNASMVFAQYRAWAKCTDKTLLALSAGSDLRSVYKSLSIANSFNPGSELIRAEMQELANFCKGMTETDPPTYWDLSTVNFASIDDGFKAHAGTQFRDYNNDMAYWALAQALIYDPKLNRFDKLADRLMDLRLQRLRERQECTQST